MTREIPREATGYQVVKPPQDLRSKVRILNDKEAANFDPVKAAEAALERLSGEFDTWMNEESKTLFAIWSGLGDAPMSEKGANALFRAAHDIRGHAETLGYPLAGEIAGNFCYLIENIKPAANIPRQLAAQHIEAIRAIVTEGAKSEENSVAKALVERLVDVTDDFISRHASADGREKSD